MENNPISNLDSELWCDVLQEQREDTALLFFVVNRLIPGSFTANELALSLVSLGVDDCSSSSALLRGLRTSYLIYEFSRIINTKQLPPLIWLKSLRPGTYYVDGYLRREAIGYSVAESKKHERKDWLTCVGVDLFKLVFYNKNCSCKKCDGYSHPLDDLPSFMNVRRVYYLTIDMTSNRQS